MYTDRIDSRTTRSKAVILGRQSYRQFRLGRQVEHFDLSLVNIQIQMPTFEIFGPLKRVDLPYILFHIHLFCLRVCQVVFLGYSHFAPPTDWLVSI